MSGRFRGGFGNGMLPGASHKIRLAHLLDLGGFLWGGGQQLSR
jgi:hypothetical protein